MLHSVIESSQLRIMAKVIDRGRVRGRFSRVDACSDCQYLSHLHVHNILRLLHVLKIPYVHLLIRQGLMVGGIKTDVYRAQK